MTDPTAGDTRATAQGTGAAAPSARRSARRRVVAPPTNPEADQSDDVPAPAHRAGEHRPTAPVRLDPRDSWILEQRPPHWD